MFVGGEDTPRCDVMQFVEVMHICSCERWLANKGLVSVPLLYWRRARHVQCSRVPARARAGEIRGVGGVLGRDYVHNWRREN